MTKLYAVPVILYVEAFDKERAAASAEMSAFTASEALRGIGTFSGAKVKDKFVVVGVATQVSEIPKHCYDKEKIIKVFGENRGIAILQDMIGRVTQ